MPLDLKMLGGIKALTKTTLCQTLRKSARRGSKPADKGAYMDVSDRGLQVPLTTQAKITSNFSSFEVIFAFVEFVSDLMAPDLKMIGRHLLHSSCISSE